MNLKTLSGKEVAVNVRRLTYPMRSELSSKSKSQYRLGQKLLQIFPNTGILEEFSIPESRMSLDFFVPTRSIAFEFQGVQHDKMNPFFHATKEDFERQKSRDSLKRRWCQINNIILVEVRDANISVADLRKEILKCYE